MIWPHRHASNTKIISTYKNMDNHCMKRKNCSIVHHRTCMYSHRVQGWYITTFIYYTENVYHLEQQSKIWMIPHTVHSQTLRNIKASKIMGGLLLKESQSTYNRSCTKYTQYIHPNIVSMVKRIHPDKRMMLKSERKDKRFILPLAQKQNTTNHTSNVKVLSVSCLSIFSILCLHFIWIYILFCVQFVLNVIALYVCELVITWVYWLARISP